MYSLFRSRGIPLAEGGCCLLLAGILLFRGEPIRAGISEAMQTCIRVLIPSLFPFMVLAAFCSRRYHPGGKSSLPARLFALPEECLPAVFLGWVGGYPVCAQCLRSLKKEDVPPQILQDLANSCTAAGPAFVVTVVGCGMLGRPEIGVRLLLCHLTACLCLLLSGRKKRARLLKTSPSPTVSVSPPPSFSVCLTDSVSAAIHGMLTMCGFVLLFTGVGNLLSQGFAETFGKHTPLHRFLFSFLEVTAGARACTDRGDWLLLAFALGWGGCCVQMQVLALLRDLPISAGKFLLARLYHGVLSALFLWGSLQVFPVSQTVFLTDASPLQPSFFAGIPGCAALLCACGLFLFALPRRIEKTD